MPFDKPMVMEPGTLSEPAVFHDTRWTVVRAAARADDPAAHAAFAQLCRGYWYPLYAYLRGRGYARHDAQDLTQGFFLRLLDGRLVNQADARKGRFRSFLLTALGNYVRDEHDRDIAQRRGGQYRFVPIEEADEAEARVGSDLAEAARLGPEAFYEAQWAGALVDAALDRLRDDLHSRGRGVLFEQLRPFLTGGEELPPDAGAGSLGLNRNALRTALHRLRRQYGQLLREEVARTVDASEDVDTELRHLCAVLARQSD